MKTTTIPTPTYYLPNYHHDPTTGQQHITYRPAEDAKPAKVPGYEQFQCFTAHPYHHAGVNRWEWECYEATTGLSVTLKPCYSRKAAIASAVEYFRQWEAKGTAITVPDVIATVFRSPFCEQERG